MLATVLHAGSEHEMLVGSAVRWATTGSQAWSTSRQEVTASQMRKAQEQCERSMATRKLDGEGTEPKSEKSGRLIN